GREVSDRVLSGGPPLRKRIQQVAGHMPRGCPHARLDGGDVCFGAEAPAQLRLGEPVAPAEGPQQLSKRMPSHEPTSDPGALRGSRRSPENSYHKSTRLGRLRQGGGIRSGFPIRELGTVLGPE